MPETEETEYDINELKREYADVEMLRMITKYLEDNKKSPMHLYITLAGILGCTIGDTCNEKSEVESMLGLVMSLTVSAAIMIYTKQHGDEDGVSELLN